MSSRRSFLDTDNSIMERNLRFVKNDLEENLNQYFGGSSTRGNSSTNISAPPRDYKVVQPKPDGSHAHIYSNELEKRRDFLLQLGLARHDAYEMAKNSNFDVIRLEQRCQEYFARGYRQNDVRTIILSDIRDKNATYEKESFPRERSPPPLISKLYNEKLNLSMRSSQFRDRSRSRSRSRPYEALVRYQPSRSFSSNRDFDNLHVQRNDEYISREHDERRETSLKRQNFPIEEDNQRSRSYFVNRDGSPRQDIIIERYSSHYDDFLSEAGRTNIRKDRSRSYSPVKYSRDPYNYHSPPSPNRMTREEYRPRLCSPPRNDRREELYRSSRSRSPNERINEDYIPCTYSHPRNEFREERDHSSGSPKRRSSFIRERINERMRFGSETSQHSIVECFRNSPSMFDRSYKYHQPSRSPSPLLSCVESNAEKYHSRQGYFRNKTYEQTRARDYPPLRNCPPSDNRNTSSLLAQRAYEEQLQHSEKSTRNIPSLLSLNLTPNPYDLKLQSTSRKSNLNKPESNEKFKLRNTQNDEKNFFNKKNAQIQQAKIANKDTGPKKNIAKVPVIQSGLAKPLPGHLKANPREYWSKWWSRYKYIEISLPKINPNDNINKPSLFYLKKFVTFKSPIDSDVLIGKAVEAIMKTADIDETNYYTHDIYKLFHYKKYLEDPNLQNNLTPQQLNCIAPALRQFQIKTVMAFMHQAIIVKWHNSLDIIKKVQAGEAIKSNYARTLLNSKCFHYFVMQSIKELKQMCQQDWPGFLAFYESIKAKKVNIYSFGLDPMP